MRTNYALLHPPTPPKVANHREQNHYIPIANVIRMMRQALPSTAKIFDEATETIQLCITKFIISILNEANDTCKVDYRKVITIDALIEAMSKLGLRHHVEPLSTFIHRYCEAEGKDNIRAQQMILYRPSPKGPTAVVSSLVVKSYNYYPHKGVRVVDDIGGGHGEYVNRGYGGIGDYVGHGYGGAINDNTMMNYNGGSSSSSNNGVVNMLTTDMVVQLICFL
ncbi:nuclear transcription factor Y subunit B-2-like [Chenopodium quinoa]|uniref:Transcription factor CBF/NF-Y/archaeal histone domain-containing protein n=1 Tax=Chenopodium quinoa TaxID=63459 RepID=A0A803MT34_CHEQI|nr:nuclear transcription factor Y subunit B-2-like [Chenopodium quinoa]